MIPFRLVEFVRIRQIIVLVDYAFLEVGASTTLFFLSDVTVEYSVRPIVFAASDIASPGGRPDFNGPNSSRHNFSVYEIVSICK